MPKRSLVFAEGEQYHIFNRGNNSQKIFLTGEDYFIFLDRLVEKLPHSAVRIHSFSLLPTHFHLSIKLEEVFDLSTAMKHLQQSYARGFNKKYRRHGHVFDSPFKALRIESPDYLDFLSRYIHRNPIEAGLAVVPEDWQFTSYRLYEGGQLLSKTRYLRGMPSQKKGGWNVPEVDFAGTLSRFRTFDDYRAFVLTDWEWHPWQIENGIWMPMNRRL